MMSSTLIRSLIFPAICLLGMIVAASLAVRTELVLERQYQQNYGDSWEQHFEKEQGALSDKRIKPVVGWITAFALAIIVYFIYRLMIPVGHRRHVVQQERLRQLRRQQRL